MVSHLLNIDTGLADAVAKGLRLKEMPKPAPAARPTRQGVCPGDSSRLVRGAPVTRGNWGGGGLALQDNGKAVVAGEARAFGAGH